MIALVMFWYISILIFAIIASLRIRKAIEEYYNKDIKRAKKSFSLCLFAALFVIIMATNLPWEIFNHIPLQEIAKNSVYLRIR